MALSQMQVFNDYIMPATMVTLDQEIDKFNAASGGAIVLSSEGMTGDFLRESFFASLGAAQRRVNRKNANGTVTPTDLRELTGSKVKIAGGFGPIRYEPSQMSWLQRPTQQGVQAAAAAFSELLVQDQLNTAIAALVAAIGNNAGMVHTAGGGVSYSALNAAHSKFGDASSQIVANVMSGSMYHRLIGDNLDNENRLFTSNSVTVVNILNKADVVTDAPALFEAQDKEKMLGLLTCAAVVGGASDVITNVDTSNGKDRIETTFQADYSFTLGLKGYSWDEQNGGASPDDAALMTGSNWDKVAEFDKMTAGVMAVSSDGPIS